MRYRKYKYFYKKGYREKSNFVNIFWVCQTLIFYFKQFLLDEENDASKEETDDVLTDADQGGSEDAIEEDQNKIQNFSEERNESGTSDEVGSCRDHW